MRSEKHELVEQGKNVASAWHAFQGDGDRLGEEPVSDKVCCIETAFESVTKPKQMNGHRGYLDMDMRLVFYLDHDLAPA